jgi:hypothetical protein
MEENEGKIKEGLHKLPESNYYVLKKIVKHLIN